MLTLSGIKLACAPLKRLSYSLRCRSTLQYCKVGLTPFHNKTGSFHFTPIWHARNKAAHVRLLVGWTNVTNAMTPIKLDALPAWFMWILTTETILRALCVRNCAVFTFKPITRNDFFVMCLSFLLFLYNEKWRLVMERSSGLFAVTPTTRTSDVLSKWMVNGLSVLPICESRK